MPPNGGTGGTGDAEGGSGGTSGTPSLPPMTGVEGGSVNGGNSTVDVVITTNVKWTFKNAIDPEDVNSDHFIVTKVSDGSIVPGSLTINTTNTVVTFIPNGVEAATKYRADAMSVDLLDGSGVTDPVSVEFTTI